METVYSVKTYLITCTFKKWLGGKISQKLLNAISIFCEYLNRGEYPLFLSNLLIKHYLRLYEEIQDQISRVLLKGCFNQAELSWIFSIERTVVGCFVWIGCLTLYHRVFTPRSICIYTDLKYNPCYIQLVPNMFPQDQISLLQI